MLWAASCLAFFRFLRVSEFTIPSHNHYDQSSHLSLQNISIDDRANPRLLRATIKQSKTDPFWKGIHIHLGATDSSVCPVLGVLPYLTLLGTQAGSLFITERGECLTRQIFSTALDSLFTELQLNHTHYNSHSFRIIILTAFILGQQQQQPKQTYQMYASRC